MAERFDFQTAFEFVGEGELQKMIRLLDAAIAKQQQYAAAAGAAGKGGQVFTASAKQVNKAGQTVTTTMKQTAAGVKTVSTSMTAAAAASQQAAQTVTLSWQSIRRVVTGVVLARALGKVSAAITKAATDASTLQLRIEELRAIQGDAAVSADAWADALIRVSNNTGVDSIQVAEAAYQALSNQVATAHNVTELLEGSVIRLARVTATDLNTAVSGVSAILNSYSLDISHAEEVSAALFATVEQGRLRLGDIADSIGNVTIVANQLGISFQEVLGSVATLTRQGTSAANAQTFLRNAMLALIKPSKEMRKALNTLGFASGDAATKQLGLLRTLELLSGLASEGNSELEQMAKFFGRIRGLIGATGLTADLDKTAGIIGRVSNALQDFRDRGAEVEKSTFVVLQKEANEISNSFQKMFLGLRDAVAALNNVPFLDISDAVRVLTSVVGVGLVIALVKAAAAARTLQFSLAALGGPAGAAFLVGVLIGELINVQLESRKAGISAEEMSKAIALGAEEANAAWANAASRIVTEVEQATTGTGSAFQGLVDTLKAQLSEIDAALAASFKAVDRLISLEDDPVKRVKLLRAEIKAAQDLAKDAIKLGDSKEAGEFVDRAIRLTKELEKMGKIFEKSGVERVELRGTERTEIQTGRFLSGPEQVRDAEKLNKSIAAQILLQDKSAATQIQAVDFTKRTLNAAEDLTAQYDKQKTANDENLATVKAVVKSLAKAQSIAAGVVDQFGKLDSAVVEANLFGPLGDTFQADILAKVTGKTEELATLRGHLAAVQNSLTIIGETTAFDDAIISPEESAQLVAASTTLLQSVNALQEAGAKIPETITQNAGLLKTVFEQLNSVDQNKLQETLQSLKAVSSQFDTLTSSIGDMTKNVGAAAQGSDQLKANVIVASNQINASLQVMAQRVAQFQAQVNALNASLRAGQGSVNQVQGGPIPRRVGGGFADFRRFAGGGSLPGIGQDQRVASFAAGEFISNQASSAEFLPQLVAMNSGAFQRREAGGNVTSVGDINMTIQGGETAEASVRQIGNEIRRELRRGTLRLT